MEFAKIINISLAFAGISFIVFIHELGHYLFSRLNGVTVEEFAIGFGKKIFSYRAKNGTLFSFRVFPLGGFVKNKGDGDATSLTPDKNDDKKNDSINSKKPYQKFLIAIAGPLFNFLLSFVIFFTLYSIAGRQKITPKITAIAKNSIAEKLSIKEGDIIKKINEKKISSFKDIKKFIILNNNKEMNILIERKGQNINFQIPKLAKNQQIGILGSQLEVKKLNIIQSVKYAFYDLKTISIETLEGFKMLITGSVDRKNIGGPVAIINATKEAISNSLYSFLMIIAFISINLGVINLFPIPIVDGGQALIHIFEMITGKDLTYSKVKKYLFYISYVLLASLMLLALYNDITKIIFNFN